MYSQLTAIAREFNFPSITGLCLYLHFTENGVTMTPRISDDSWPHVWNNVLDNPSPSLRSPISGKVEFDIDIRQARWYASWIASAHRDHLEFDLPAAPYVAHFSEESKTTFADDHAGDDQDNYSVYRSAAPAARHVPRKLSLVDRFDSMSVRSGSRPTSRPALSPPVNPPPTGSQNLPPIFQEEEPKTARHDLQTRVKSWRASAVLSPTLLAATGQTSLEPANMPNTLPIDEALTQGDEVNEEELNLEDFAWSISSAGPNEWDPVSPISWARIPSVHLANRLEGSVCLTPSDCTSFGPSDYTFPSPVASFYRLPSPDIAYRMLEDAPPTPTTATSWGAPLSYPPSPMSYSRAPSIDLGQRNIFSRPVTPSTATSWGPSYGSWPPSAISEYGTRSIHLAERAEDSQPVTPSTPTSWGALLSYAPSPFPDMTHRSLDPAQIMPESAALSVADATPWAHTWPFVRRGSNDNVSSQSTQTIQAAPWNLVWPYRAKEQSADFRRSVSVHLPLSYPSSNICELEYVDGFG